MNLLKYRWQRLLLVFITMSVLMASFYFQYVKNMEPCPLCIMQRVCVMLLLMFGMMSLFCGFAKCGRVTSILQIIIGSAGVFFAGRQLWLQSLPADQTPACLPGLDVLINYFPWQDILHALFWGSGDCAEVSWQWLGLTMPAWAAFYFLFMIAANAYDYYRLKHN